MEPVSGGYRLADGRRIEEWKREMAERWTQGQGTGAKG
jgi:hypothetical protein